MNHPSRSSHEPLDRIEVVRGDITQLDVDAIVNAANEGLLGGGGVDGAIHQAAGPALLQACLELPELRPRVRCPTGEARLTKGFLLKARYVIHTVGPVWHGGARGEPALLAAAYRNSLRLAGQNQLQSVAFSAISTGVYGYPLELAADIAINEVSRELTQWEGLERVLFVAFGADVHRALEQARARTIAAGDARQRV